jgi:hypothetical protein
LSFLPEEKGGGALVPLPLKASVADDVRSLRRRTQPPSSATAAIHLQCCSCSRHPWPSSSSPAATVCHCHPLTRNQHYCPRVLLQDDRSIPYSHAQPPPLRPMPNTNNPLVSDLTQLIDSSVLVSLDDGFNPDKTSVYSLCFAMDSWSSSAFVFFAQRSHSRSSSIPFLSVFIPNPSKFTLCCPLYFQRLVDNRCSRVPMNNPRNPCISAFL